MMSELLPAYVQDALETNHEDLAELLQRGGDLEQVLAISQNFRVAAIGGLFMRGQFDPLGWRLFQSARAFATLIDYVPEEQRLTSRALPFFDAVAAGDWSAAEAIARKSRRTLAKGEEFEEDFLFTETAMQISSLAGSNQHIRALLDRHERCLEGTEDLRLPVMCALLARDAEGFDESLARWLDARAQDLDERAAESSFSPALLATEWHFSVEGVALVRLARARGLSTAREYPQVPAVALTEPPPEWHNRDWRVVELRL